MRRALALAALLALSGCATRPLVTSCITKEQVEELRRQEPPKIADRLTGRADEDVRVLAGSALRLRLWGHNLLNVVEVCAR